MIILQHHCYIANYCPHASMEKMFMNTENSKTNEPHKPQKSNCCTWKNIRQQYKNNILKIISPMWKDQFDLTDDSNSISDIQD